MSIFSAPAPSFYGAADKAIYDQGFSFIPQEMYRGAFVAPTFPTAPTTTTSGITTVPTTTALDVGGNRDDNNPFNPNMDQIRTDFNPRPFNLAMRKGDTVGPNPDLFFAPQSKIGGIIDLIPGIGGIKRGINVIKDMLPINQRAILENEARGAGIFTDDIGRIVGDPNTAQGIMAGYNLNKITRDTFNKRRKNIEEGLMKVDPEAARERLSLLDEAEEDLFGSVSTPSFIGPFTQGGIFGKKAAITKMRKDQRIADQKEKERLAKLEKARQDKIRLDKLRLKREAEQAAAAAAAKEKAQRAAIDKMFQQGQGGRGQDFTGGRFDRAGDRETYDRNPTDFSGSFMDGGLVDLVDIYD